MIGRVIDGSLASTAASFGARLQPPSSERFANLLAVEASKTDSKPGGSTASQTNAASQTPVVSGLQGLVPASQVPASQVPTSQAKPAAADVPAVPAGTTADDDYWNSQPVAVQQLRDIQDPNQKEQLASQLAGEGYQIDVPIMVWGWDPVTTMQLRQSFGYTWVPALGQPPIQTAPGLSVPGLAVYDPANPPAGSISVSVPT